MEMLEGNKVGLLPGAAVATDVTEERFLLLASQGLDRAYRLAGLILGNGADAEDATQDAMAAAWRARRALHDPVAFEGWFDRILVNTCRDRLRRKRRIAFVSFDPDSDDRAAPDPFVRVLDTDRVLRGLRGLTPEERTVIALHYWSDLPLSEVAGRLGWPVGTVKTRLHAGLEKLRSSVTDEMEPGGKAGRE